MKEIETKCALNWPPQTEREVVLTMSETDAVYLRELIGATSGPILNEVFNTLIGADLNNNFACGCWKTTKNNLTLHWSSTE